MGDCDQDKMLEVTRCWTRAQPVVSAFISAMIPVFHDSEDVLQRVATTLVKKFDSYDRERSFTGWAIGIAKYEILNYRRRKAQDKHVFDEQIVSLLAEAYQEAEPDYGGIRKALKRCVEQVQGRNRRLLDMYYGRGYKSNQIGEALRMTQNAVLVTLHRIRVALRDCVHRRLASPEDSL